MALASAPSTPDRASAPGFRRAFTAPIRLPRSIVPTAGETVDGAETLYAHGSVKILSFSHSTSSVRNGRAELQDEPIGTLPWASPTERTIATGPLRIYKVLGTAFLSSGTTLQPLLAKSQCWCVDGESKMVLRIRQNTYYRIELPSHTFEENKKVDQLKTVLASVLQYETTSCPFKRGFTVDLPEPPKTPIQKRPWRPKPGPTGSPPEVSEDFNRKAVFMNNRLSRSPCSNEIDTAENLVFQEGEIRNHSTPAPSDVSSLESMDDEGSKATDDIGFIRKDLPGNVYDERDDSKTPTRPKSLRAGRAVTAPPQLTLSTASPLNSATDAQTIPKQQRESSSLASSVDSFHSFHSPISPLSSSPPFPTSSKPHATIVAPRIRSHKRDVSDITVTAGSPELWDFSDGRSSDESSYHSPPDLPATPPLVRDTASPDDNQWPEAITPPPPTVLRRRPETRQRRNQSPLPPSSNLYSPYSPRSQMSGHHLTTAILQRTCSLLLGPPVQLVALMMRIAAKIARGAFRGTSFGFGEGGQKIPCSWDFSDGDEADDLWEEDDFGVALGNPGSSRGSGAKEVGGSWEID